MEGESPAFRTAVGLLDDWRDRGRFVEVVGQRVFVVTEGDIEAPPLLLLHGYPTSAADFRLVVDDLARDFYVVLHDHLGFGLSDKPEDYSYSLIEQAEVAAALWRKLGLETGHLLAHDYGTSVATELLARRERKFLGFDFRSITLCNGSVHIELARPRLVQYILPTRLIGPLVARFVPKSYFIRKISSILGDPGSVGVEEWELQWLLTEQNGGRRRLPAISSYLAERTRYWHRWIPPLERLDVPTHILWGDRDPVARPAIARELHGEIPGAELTWLENLGHYPMLEDPARWTAAVLGFLSQQAEISSDES